MTPFRWVFPFILIPPLIAISFSYFIPGPVHYYDEGGVIANSLAVAGHASDASNHYYFGYPILLSPSFLFSDVPAQSFRLVQFTNMLVYSLSCFIIYAVVRRLSSTVTNTPPKSLYCLALAACLYPPFISFTSMAWSENLIFLLVVAMCFLLFEFAQKPSIRSITPLAICIGFTLWLHPRLLPVIPAVMLATPLVRCGGQLKQYLVIFLLVIFVMAGAYHALLHPYLESIRAPSAKLQTGQDYLSGNVLTTLIGFQLREYSHILARVLGQLALFNINGLCLPGMLLMKLAALHFGRGSRVLSGEDRAVTPVVVFLALALVGTAILVGCFFELQFADRPPDPGDEIYTDALTNRMDHWIYGRYADVFLPVFLVISFFYRDKKFLFFSMLATVLLVILTALITPLAMYEPNYINLLALWPIHLPLLEFTNGTSDKIYLVKLLSIGLLGNFSISFILLKSRFLPICMGMLFVATTFLDLGITREHEIYTQARYRFGDAMRASLTPGACIYVDVDSFTLPHGMYAFFVIPHELYELPPASAPKACQGLITANPLPFQADYRLVTAPTDGFYGMVR